MNTLSGLKRPWEIWLVHHTHVDIGYTEPQEIILRKHAEFVAQALDFCNATDQLPEGERFCWTCEVAWTVKAFLSRYPERADEFFRRVREGRIEVTALYLQLTDLFTQELLEETTDYALALARKHGFEVVTAMNDDVNGWAWGLPDLLASRGVRYMDTAINETRALGVRPRPAMFRWIGPQGGNVLFWHSDGYLFGNGLKLDQDGAEECVAAYLYSLEGKGFPISSVELRIHGERHDNSPPGLWICDAVRRWNAAHPSGPGLRLGTARQWFEHAAAAWPASMMDIQAAWPDWWADGNGSAAAESALVRQAQAELRSLASLTSATGRKPPDERIESAREAAAFFCEHTWGAWCSTDMPACLNSKSQWSTKAGYAYTAVVEAHSLLQETLAAEGRLHADGNPAILVFNPSSASRTDVVDLSLADADLGLPGCSWLPAPLRSEPGKAFHLLDEESGEAISLWRVPTIADSARRPAQRIRFLAREIPARSFRRFRVIEGEAPASPASCELRNNALNSPSLTVHADRRGINAICDTRSGSGCFSSAEYALGEVIYESIPGPFGREKLSGWGVVHRDCQLVRTPIRFGAPEPIPFPFGAGMRLAAVELPGTLRSLTLDILLYADLQRVDLFYRMEKNPTNEAEALYVAFPLAPNPEPRTLNPSTVHLDTPGAVMRPGLDQVPGTATDWHSIQNYFAVSDRARTIVVASPDIPLVQVNGINTGKWQESLPSHNGIVMSWVMNNYWFTNFPAAQGGEFSWMYSIKILPGPFDSSDTSRFAGQVRQPLIAAGVGTRPSEGCKA